MRNFILSTDWWTDCDDAVALRMLAAAVKRGEINLLSIVVNAYLPETIPCILAFMDDCGLAGTPLAIDRDATDFKGKPKYQYPIAEMVGDKYASVPVEEPVPMMRRLITEADGPVEIIEIGFPQCLAALVEAEPALVAEKVSHLWIMAGNFQNEEHGSEHNFNNTPRSAMGGSIVCEKWPTPVTLLGWEVGHTVITGSKLDADDLLKKLMVWHGSVNGRSSWDPMTVDLALRGSAAAAGYEAVKGWCTVHPETGENSFRRDPEGRHEYVKKLLADEVYAERIDTMIAR